MYYDHKLIKLIPNGPPGYISTWCEFKMLIQKKIRNCGSFNSSRQYIGRKLGEVSPLFIPITSYKIHKFEQIKGYVFLTKTLRLSDV